VGRNAQPPGDSQAVRAPRHALLEAIGRRQLLGIELERASSRCPASAPRGP
jgi:hypothetical protein